MEGDFTVTLHLNSFFPALAVIVAVPAFFAVTFPFCDTTATFLLEEDQVTFDFVPVIFRTAVFPFVRARVFLLILADAAWTVCACERTGVSAGRKPPRQSISESRRNSFLIDFIADTSNDSSYDISDIGACIFKYMRN